MRPAHVHFLVNAPGYEPLITHVFPLSRIEEAIDTMESRQAMKVILHPNG